MRIIDISVNLFTAPVYPGDPTPTREALRQLALGDSFELSAYSAGCHSGTHIDAPAHYIQGGGCVEDLPLEACFGPCLVAEARGIVTGADIDGLAGRSERRLLLKGEGGAWLSQSAAFALADAGFLLVGTDAQSIAPPGDETAPHTELLAAGLVVLEGLCLTDAEPGSYTLAAFPVKLGGAEAAPVRAVLLAGE